ncbi:DUF397 domain-containing protein [Streptomyces sp. NPDC087440]|uniref:DUF397 domain-containing protein n=1 Tax=Streptomyces sp. NPDC087440 TaxID=3365790 RepID=UPI00382D8505
MINASTLPTTWRKSTYSSTNGGECLEVGELPLTWRKSTYSSANGGECLEIGEGVAHLVPVRDSKNPDGPALIFPAAAFTTFISAVQHDVLGKA